MFTTKFGEKLAEGLAGQWAAQKLAPALVFWVGGLLAWHGGLRPLGEWIKGIDNTPVYIALAIGGLLLVTVSGAAAQWLQTSVIRLAEGYWPGPFQKPRFFLIKHLKKHLETRENRWNELADILKRQQFTAEEYAEYAQLDALLNRNPVNERLYMPTTLGNLLRSAEEYPRVRYGLDAIVFWPRLWLLMPKETLTALSEAREQLNFAAPPLMLECSFHDMGYLGEMGGPVPGIGSRRLPENAQRRGKLRASYPFRV